MEEGRYGIIVFYFVSVVVAMIKWFKSLFIYTFIAANVRVASRVGLGVALFLSIELIYSKYRDPSLNISDDLRWYILIAYSFIQFTIILWVIFSLRFVIWDNKEIKESLKAKASFEKMPQELKDLSDISKYPDL